MSGITVPAKKLTKLLAKVNYRLYGDIGVLEVTSIKTDSRKVVPGALFVAISGGGVDGHDFICQARQNGCVAVVGEKGCGSTDGIPFVEVEDSRVALSELAIAFYDNPAQKLVLIGITGTNGKTTTTYLLESIIRLGGGNPGVIGTVNYRFNGEEFPAPFTTPEPIILQKMLREMVQGGVSHLVMEVSSHSLVQKRIHGLKFNAALFTNLSRDHLDFHGTMEEYFEAKKLLFKRYITKNGTAFIFCDRGGIRERGGEDWGGRIIEELQAGRGKRNMGPGFEVFSCGFENKNDLHITEVSYGLTETKATAVFQGETIRIKSGLVGEFNLKNILLSVGGGLALGLSGEEISKGIAAVKNVPGRLERVDLSAADQQEKKDSLLPGCRVFVDYAHTPDALHNVLETMRKVARQRIIVVFGCGGDRDTGKRFPMGEVAGRLADIVVVTTDNSRSESPGPIMAEIERGVVAAGATKTGGLSKKDRGYIVIADRAEAIKYAVAIAGKDDVVLLAGKGHENYQITGESTVYFDDRVEARKQLEQLYRHAV